MMKSVQAQVDWEKTNGLVPAIVQHTISGRVLMLGYMNVDALTETLTSEWVTFYSRSRRRLWTKGETSGNKLKLGDIAVDCDGDTLLVNATPHGPTCHLGAAGCFDRDKVRPGFGFIGQLESIINDSDENPSRDSYTARLMNDGIQRIAQKVGEEGVEVALAAVTGDRNEIIGEVADLVYHVLVLLHHQELGFSDVAQQLEGRHRKIQATGSPANIGGACQI